jgi:hypothetical protein
MEHQRKNPHRKAGASLGGDPQSNSAKSAESPFAYCKTYSLPKGRTIKFRFDATSGEAHCEWSPDIPKGKILRKLWPHYFAARHDFFSGLGGTVVVIEP